MYGLSSAAAIVAIRQIATARTIWGFFRVPIAGGLLSLFPKL